MAPVALPIGMAAAGALTKGIGAYKGSKEAEAANKIKKIQTAWSPWTGKTPQEYTPSPSMLGSIVGGGAEGASLGASAQDWIDKGNGTFIDSNGEVHLIGNDLKQKDGTFFGKPKY
jgi:hypothetical protein